ncbi:MAG TPA: response regulator [Thermoanaerobaculia bacterium]|jgi:CheY-like chemotaxis protein|nr:response regulator [Thermoanaerobaculia bacterium]
MVRKPLILVVDDDEPILLLMRNLLREFGFEAMAANSGHAAVQTARSRTPDLILLDKNMPGMTGEEVLRALHEHSDLREVPVLILSGEPVDPNELSRLGATGAVQKPFDVPALVETIRSHVSAKA